MAQRLVSTVWDESNGTIQYMWYMGKGNSPVPMLDTNGNPVIVDVNKIPESTRMTCTLHGTQQKNCDGFSDAEKDSGGNPDVKKQIIVSTILDSIQRLYNGEWGAEREGSGVSRVGLLVRALARVKGWSVEVAREKLSGIPDEKVKLIRADSRIKSAMEAIKAEDAAKKPAKVDVAAVAAAVDSL